MSAQTPTNIATETGPIRQNRKATTALGYHAAVVDTMEERMENDASAKDGRPMENNASAKDG